MQLFWLEQSGAAIAYSKIAPGDSFRQHTYAGHVWAIAKPNGDYLAIFQADTEPRIALIDGSTPARAAPRGGGGGGGAGRSPDGSKRIAFRDHNAILNRGDNETPITTNGSESSYYEGGVFWSPNSASAVFFRTAPGEKRKIHIVESSPRDQVQPKLRTFDYEKPGDRLDHPKPVLWRDGELIEIDDSLFPNPWPSRRVEWAPDSRSFILVYNQRGHQLMRVVRVDAQTGQSKLIIEEKTDTFIDYTNKIVRHFLWDTEEIVWMSERSGWNHLYLFDMKTGELKNPITQGQWVVRGVDRVDAEKRQIWFRAGGIHPAQDPYHVHYCRVDFDGSNLTILTQGDGTHTVSYSPNGQWMLDVYSRVDLPPVTELRRASDGSLVMEIERADASELIAEGWKPPVRFVAKGRDGQTDIYGILFFPMNHDPTKKYPVIENVYAGPQGSHVRKNFAINDMRQSLAELGFIVVQADGMGTSNRSKAFHDVCFKNLADAGFPDRIAWLRAAAQQYPSIDLNRVGIYGGSAGGQNALGGMLLHGDFYKAAVADCGCHDNRMDKVWWNEQWMGYPLGEHYDQQSNVTLAPKLQGKLLLMVGELDNNVDPASTMQVVNALIRADKDFELLVMPGIGHGTYGTPYGRRRLMDFFVRSLWNAEPRAAGETNRNTEN
ncbi:MAG: prolyl oligopeptidase family serine peptidase [Armatimonadetes bacterium]|nr:prolyl oligopeptidase family serine peptidase [Armatimonadota bacterium]